MAAEETPPNYRLYGLDDLNPYHHRTLDPLARPDDRRLQLDLDGFLRTSWIGDQLKRSIAAGRPAFVVVSGRDRSGRTSTANHILDAYRELRQVGHRFLLADLDVDEHADFTLVQQVMAELYNAILDARIVLSPETTAAVEKIGEAPQNFFKQWFQRIAKRVGSELAGQEKPYAFGLRFEGLPEARLISVMKHIFKSTPCVVVFTHQNRDHHMTAPTAQIMSALDDDGMFVALKPLSGGQVRVLAESRWRNASHLDCPFDPEGVQEVFREPPVPIALALKRLEWFLDTKLRTVETDDPWPENTHLALTHRWLTGTNAMVDSYPR